MAGEAFEEREGAEEGDERDGSISPDRICGTMALTRRRQGVEEDGVDGAMAPGGGQRHEVVLHM